MASFLLSLVAFSILTASVATLTLNDVRYVVTNNATNTLGGERYDSEVGADFTVQVLRNATVFVWKVFEQGPDERKDVHEVHLYVRSADGIANTDGGSNIFVSADYIGNFSGDVRPFLTGVLYHEVTHVWQWNGQGTAPGGLTEGIADYVMFKAGMLGWGKPGAGSRWDEGYEVTAMFLDYCASFKSSFVADLNKLMKDKYSDGHFQTLLGKPLDQLWADYKAKYGGGGQAVKHPSMHRNI
ncbi:hypothetical protein Taro_005690 [Colocasia esculenta]|uniref:Plant basic secretory protein (BSP) family protein n=1 Tax=Colocasia esculenta TaxID=4460 RepID=A0A843TYK8_COLES|nr:hypothetical protein [Colocasia esculenta]